MGISISTRPPPKPIARYHDSGPSYVLDARSPPTSTSLTTACKALTGSKVNPPILSLHRLEFYFNLQSAASLSSAAAPCRPKLQ